MSNYDMENFLDLFPKGRDKIRLTQEIILTDIKKELDKGTKFIIAEAPTGTGKSDTAIHLALYKKGGTVLTTQKILQDQYAKEFKFLKEVKGKNEFPCHQEDDKKQCDEGICKFPNGKYCRHYVKQNQVEITSGKGTKLEQVQLMTTSKKTECDYYLQRIMGEKASFTTYNYAKYFSTYLRDLSPEVNAAQHELLICDEAHSLEGQLADYGALKLSTDHATKVKNKECEEKIIVLRDEWKKIEDDQVNEKIFDKEFEKKADEFIIKTIDIAKKLIPAYVEKISMIREWIEGKEERQTKMDDFNFEKDYKDFTKEHKRFAKLQTELEELVKIEVDLVKIIEIKVEPGQNNDFVFGGIEIDEKTHQDVISIKPIDVKKIAGKLFDKFKHVIFFSSTIDEEYFQKELGIPPTDSFYKRYDSEFPAENRKIVKKYRYRLSMKQKENEINKGMIKIQDLLDKHKSEKGIILVSSYEYEKLIWERLSERNQKRVKQRSKGQTQAEFVEQHKDAKDNQVLISPSLWEGVDLKNGEGRFQIIAKAPYLTLGDLRIKKKRDNPEFGNRWWLTYSLHKLIQGCGRSIRHKTDWAITYLIDGNCDNLLLKEKVPKWFDDALTVTEKKTPQAKYQEYEEKEEKRIRESEFETGELNPEQKLGVEADADKAVLIQAGPGTGKTRMIVERVKHLILKKHVPAEKILCLTFTKIARQEMEDRLTTDDTLDGKDKDFPPTNVKTFHQLGLKILDDARERERDKIANEISSAPSSTTEEIESRKLLNEKYTKLQAKIKVENKTQSLIQDIIRMKKLKTIYDNYKIIRNVSTGISAHKGEGITPLNVQEFAAGLEEDDTTRDQWVDFANVFEEYNKRLEKMGKIDFEDMLQKSLDILQSDENIRKKYREEWHYVLVDEYQDNNYLQTEITKEIAPEGKITVVGDINQCVYSWRGANIKNFEIFKDKYKDNYLEFPISQNYRSTQKIVDVATKLTPNTKLSTKNEPGRNISVDEVENEEMQGKFIIEKINEHINTKIDRLKPNHKISYRDFQIMARINIWKSDLKVVEDQLREECIPFVSEVNEVMQPDLSVLNEIKSALTKFMNEEKLNDETNLDDLIKKLDSEIVREKPEKRKYYQSLKNLAEDYVRNHKEDMIDGFKKYLKADSGINNFVVLKTVHKSKGTEKPIVFIIGLNNRLWPFVSVDAEKYSIPNELRHHPLQAGELATSKIEEEKRLFFVALTRAKNLLYITFKKQWHWQDKELSAQPSEYLEKINYEDNPDIDFTRD